MASSKTLKQQFANRVKTLRARKEMSATALAKSAEVSPASVWQWEHAGAMPRKPTLNKLATLFGVSPDFLLNGDEQTIPVADASPSSPSRSSPSGSLHNASLEDLIKAIQMRGFRIRIETV